jgi:hypothetical protein
MMKQPSPKNRRAFRLLFWILTGWLLFFSPCSASSLPVQPGRFYDFGPYLGIGRDPSGALTLQDILDQDPEGFFHFPESLIPSIGYTSDTVWLTLPLENPLYAPQPFIFSLQIARLRQVDWFLVVDGRVVDQRAEGLDRPARTGLRSRFPMFPVTLPAEGDTRLMVRIVSDHAIFIPLNGVSEANLFEAETRWNFSDYLFLGFGLAMIVFALLVSLAHPGAGFIHLSAITFFFQSYYMLYHGYLDWFFPGLPLWFHRNLILISVSMAYSLLMRFSQRYFLSQSLSPRETVFYKWGTRACFVSVIVMGFGPFAMGIHMVIIMNAFVYLTGLWFSFRQFLKTRNKSDACFLVAWIWISMTLLSFVLQVYIPILGRLHPMMITRLVIPMMYFFFLAANLQRQFSLREERENTLQARQAAVRANLAALRYQLNPHFLFNALNAIDGLSRIEPEKISRIVRKLATFLRLRLKPSKTGLLPLSEELLICRSYLDIEKMRFEERLQVSWQIDEESENKLVPEMILQPLIENAVKYGLKQNETLKITVSSRIEKNQLCLYVKNTGKLLESSLPKGDDSQTVGIGLNNLQQRLHYQYGTQGDFTLAESMGWVVATVRIPAKKAPDESYSVFNY